MSTSRFPPPSLHFTPASLLLLFPSPPASLLRNGTVWSGKRTQISSLAPWFCPWNAFKVLGDPPLCCLRACRPGRQTGCVDCCLWVASSLTSLFSPPAEPTSSRFIGVEFSGELLGSHDCYTNLDVELVLCRPPFSWGACAFPCRNPRVMLKGLGCVVVQGPRVPQESLDNRGGEGGKGKKERKG